MLPLHQDAQGAQKGKDFHAGLWYDRFFNCYNGDWEIPADDEQKNIRGKKAWVTESACVVGVDSKLQAYTDRQNEVIAACGGTILVMSSQWHFVTGLGNNHPVENGFAWHHTLGVPYLTGAAVKGMVRAWCEVWAEFDAEKIKHWFGDTEQSGELIFFDAVPTQSVQLKADMMTPHYGKWYAEGDQAPKADGSNVPADWHDPNPIPFLVVDKGQSFQFGIAKRTDSDINLQDVSDTLTKALQWLGAGAKTAAGYGRFEEDKQEKARREEAMREQEKQAQKEKERQQMQAQAAASGLTGLALDISVIVQEKKLQADKSAWVREAEGLIQRIQQHEDAKEKGEAWQLLIDICEKHDPGIMSNPDKTKGKKNKPVFKPSVIAIAKALLVNRT